MLDNENPEEIQAEGELTLREELENAFNEVKAEPEETEAKPSRTRDETGKFAKLEKQLEIAPEAIKEPTATQEPAVTQKELNAPNSWRENAKAKWATLDPDVKAEILRREDDQLKAVTRNDEERQFGKSLKEVITPYLPIIQAEGGTPVVAVQSLLNTAYQLRTGTPQQKADLIKRLAHEYGADLTQITAETDEYIAPEVKALQQQVNQLQAIINNSQQNIEQQQKATLQSEISAFAADPKNVHYETVKADMAALLSGGRANSLQDAYDKAVWASPEIRSTLIEQQNKQSEAQRIAEQKAKAEAARKVGVSVKGAPGVAVPNTGSPDRTLREELQASLRAVTGQI